MYAWVIGLILEVADAVHRHPTVAARTRPPLDSTTTNRVKGTMANPEHIAWLLEGVDAWNKRHQNIYPSPIDARQAHLVKYRILRDDYSFAIDHLPQMNGVHAWTVL